MQGNLTKNRRGLGYVIGILITATILAVFFSPLAESFLPAGPMLLGHETLRCQACHKDERGTLRQRIQANVQYLFNRRASSVALGYRPVSNSQCIHCHNRPNDRHPVYRFMEPKYREVRQLIGAHECVSCHREHNSNRVSASIDFCRHCHDELKLSNDPVDTSHEELIRNKRWSTCLSCHDFHGNHRMKVPSRMARRIVDEKLEAYLKRGQQAYPGEIIYKARKQGYEK